MAKNVHRAQKCAVAADIHYAFHIVTEKHHVLPFYSHQPYPIRIQLKTYRDGLYVISDLSTQIEYRVQCVKICFVVLIGLPYETP